MNNLLASNGPMSIILLVVIVVGMVGLLIWQSISGKKKQKEAQSMVDNLKKGDRVKTIGGICGFVAEINNEENTFVLETGTEDKKSYVKFDKAAIYQTAPAQGSAVASEQAAKEQDKKVEEKKEESAEVKAEEKPAEEKKTAKKSTKKAKKATEETEEVKPTAETPAE